MNKPRQIGVKNLDRYKQKKNIQRNNIDNFDDIYDEYGMLIKRNTYDPFDEKIRFNNVNVGNSVISTDNKRVGVVESKVKKYIKNALNFLGSAGLAGLMGYGLYKGGNYLKGLYDNYQIDNNFGTEQETPIFGGSENFLRLKRSGTVNNNFPIATSNEFRPFINDKFEPSINEEFKPVIKYRFPSSINQFKNNFKRIAPSINYSLAPYVKNEILPDNNYSLAPYVTNEFLPNNNN